ncbi:PAS domain S-box protein [Pseudanabaena sp. FACHB-2040]|uniref:hybrid sensor histidine kinase/response regulator n=1 Tax=Pseudanabaena sp. FACHB-2040 TaxID=2692859 RepID=UPI0016859D86|nr:PAS domain S-box protein [Pseudanabaena sp. FACHB-2040]MBD2256003.1 PAS domain S-box protein [Pseudanabaena sp. FACHB-2040]
MRLIYPRSWFRCSFPWLLSYGVALLAVALALVLTLYLQQALAFQLFAMFYVAVAVSAWAGGLGPGILAALLSAGVINHFLIYPLYQPSPGGIYGWIRLGVFLLVALPIGTLNGNLKVAEQRMQAALLQLQESEQQYRQIVETANEGIWVIDPEGITLYANPRMGEILGCAAEDLVGQSAFDFVFEEDQQEAKQRFAERLQGVRSRSEFRLRRCDRTPVWIQNGISFLEDEQGRCTRILNLVTDITEQKQVADSVREGEQYLSLVLETGRLGAWQLDLRTFELQSSAQFRANLGQPLDTELSQQQVLALIHPEDRERVEESVRVAIATRTDYDIEYRTRWPDGSQHWLTARGRCFYNDWGHPLRMVGVTLDVSDRKQVEEVLRANANLYRTLSDVVPDFIWSCNAEARIDFGNARLLDYIGYTLEQISQDPTLINHPEDLPHLQAAWADAQARGGSCEVEFRMRRHDGVYRWFISRAVPLKDEAGQIIKWIGTTTDIHERKQAEEALRHREEELRLITDAVPVLISYVDADQRYRFHNRSYEIWFGKPRAEIYGKTLWEVLGDAAYEIIHPYVEQVLSGQAVSFEQSLPYSGTDGRFVQASYIPRFNDHNEVEGFVALVNDVTQQKQAELTQRSHQELFRLAHLVGGIGTYEWSLQTGNVWWSEEMERLYGFTPGSFGGCYEDWLQILYPDDREAADQAAQRTITAGTDFDTSFRILRPDGSLRWIAARARIFRDNQGHPLRVVGVNMDITERKQAEEALRYSEELFRRMTETLEDVFWVAETQPTYQLLYISPGYEQIWGHPREQIYDNPKEWLEAVYSPDQEPLGAGLLADLSQQHSLEFQVVHADGSVRWVRNRTFPIQEADGSSHRIAGIAEDITERKQAEVALRQSEEQYRFLTEAIPQLVWTADATGRNEYVNQQMCDYIGLTQEQLLALSWQETVHPDDRDNVLRQWLKATHEAKLYELEYRLRRADGVYRWHLVRAVPFKDSQGQVIRWFGAAVDIHEKKAVEEQRLRLLQQEQIARANAERANRIKDEFLAVLSHELRSPLNPVLGWVKMLLRGTLEPARQQYALETIERNVKLQVQLVDDLLDVSRILRGKLNLEMAPVDLQSTLLASIETVRLAAEAKAISIHTDFDPQVGPVLGDAGRLQQVIWNLLSNAVKFTPNGGRVEVKLALGTGQATEADGERQEAFAQIIVTDTGKGISPAFLPHVFEHFRQEDGATTRQFGGLGLGLAIARYLSEMHGGLITADSPGEGLGATFTVQLPLVPQAASLPTPEALSPGSLEPLPLQGIQILIVDDDDDTRACNLFVLEQAGATVTQASSGEEALHQFQQSPPDLLICDIGMPYMDGYQVIQTVRQIEASAAVAMQGKSLPATRQSTPAVALTAYAGAAYQQRVLAAGFQHHLSKPVDPDELIKAVLQLIKR